MNTFSDLNLSAPVAKAVSDLGFEKPSDIQAQSLPILLGEPTDFIGQAATGTGKTAAFGIPLLEQLDPKLKAVQALILCPTRELALQVSRQIDLLGKYLNVQSLPIYGGAGYGDQIHGLKSGAQIVVGTPGRLIDHLERGILKLDQLKTLVLDEADEMISMGFKDELEKILEASPEDSSQIWLFSATLSKEVRRVASKYLTNPAQVQVNKTEMLSNQVEQLYYMSRESDKPEILCKLIEAADDFYGLIFCQTKSLVTDLTQYLSSRGYQVDSLHGDKTQNDRERTMQAFRDRRVTILVCTDVASRGLDVKDVTHVVNYSIPRELDIYVHRIGRTARGGKTGIAMSLVTPSHRNLIGRIENMTKSRMIAGAIPSRKDIGTIKVAKMFSQFSEQKTFQRAVELLSPDWQAAINDMPASEIVGRFLTLLSPEIFESQDRSKPLQAYVPTDERGNALKRSNSDGRGGEGRGRGRSNDRSRSRGGEGRGRNDRFERKETRGRSENQERPEGRVPRLGDKPKKAFGRTESGPFEKREEKRDGSNKKRRSGPPRRGGFKGKSKSYGSESHRNP